MKRIFYILVMALAVMTGCQKESLKDKICGEWRLTSPESNLYISFAPDGTFEEFWKQDDGPYEFRTGTWTLSDNIVSGTYDDGTAWAYSYSVLVTGPIMTMTPQGNESQEYVYVHYSIPAVVRENSQPQ